MKERSLSHQPFALKIIPQMPYGIANGPLVIIGWSLQFDIKVLKRFFDKMSLGERALDMLVCQPPVSEVYAWAQCCANKYDPEHHISLERSLRETDWRYAARAPLDVGYGKTENK